MNQTANHGVVTVAILLLNNLVLKHNHMFLDGDNLGYALFLANSVTLAVRPVIQAVWAKWTAKVEADVAAQVAPAAPAAH